MRIYKPNADASFGYRESSAVDRARFESAAVPGNLADVMKDSVVRFPDLEPVEYAELTPLADEIAVVSETDE